MSQAEASVNLTAGLAGALGLEFVETGPDRVVVRWTVAPQHLQPFGIVHGGVHCAVVETAASVGAQYWLVSTGVEGYVVGVNNNTDFLRAVREGVLTAVAGPVHRGRLQQLWDVTITDGSERLVARGQVRLQNVTGADRLGR